MQLDMGLSLRPGKESSSVNWREIIIGLISATNENDGNIVLRVWASLGQRGGLAGV